MSNVFGVILPDGSKHEIEDKRARTLLGEGGGIFGAADYVTPQMYGAIGDGETDDYEAFAKMLAAIPKKVYIPAGKYYVSQSVVIQNGVEVIEGAGRKTTKIVGEKAVFTTNEEVIYGLSMSNLEISNDGTDTGIEGAFRYCHFFDLTVWGAKYGILLNKSSWTNTFTRCEISHCEQALRLAATENNNNIFSGCWFENNEYVLYSSSSGGKNIAFEGCLIQNNEVAFRTVGMSAFVVRDSYIENNGHIFEIYTACYGAAWTVENCFIYSDSERNGWFLSLPSIAAVPAQNIAMFNIEKCYIRHASGRYKPFAFHATEGDGNVGQIAVNVNDCMFYHQPNSYIDLFNLDSCPNYGGGWNRLPIKTDLVYYQNETCKWFLRSGNGAKYQGPDRYFELVGYLVPNQKNSTGDIDGVNVEIPAIVGKVENGYLGGVAYMDVSSNDGAGGSVRGYSPMMLDSVTVGGLHFTFTEGKRHPQVFEKLYVTGLKY